MYLNTEIVSIIKIDFHSPRNKPLRRYAYMFFSELSIIILQNDLMTNTIIVRNIRDNEHAKEFLISVRGVRAV